MKQLQIYFFKFLGQYVFDSLAFSIYLISLMERWTVGEDRPNNGSLVQLITENGVTKLVTA